MRILVSNDDGVFSPGIRALARLAQEFGEVRVVAPDVEQSAMSHAITVRTPLHYQRTPIDGLEAYRVDGTPADCVALGAHHWDAVELVLTGINLGLNIGHNIWHSGTVAAAKQAAFLGIPAIAFSAPYSDGIPDYGIFEPYVRDIIAMFMELPETPLLNVNFPQAPRGLRWTRQSVRHYEGLVVPGEDPMGRKHYWFSEKPRRQVEEGTDRWAVDHGFVSLTPLRLDLTDDSALARAQAQLEPGPAR
ncbi:MAG TPA: 5'/3'-nucleotidase SurE [Trueperaceae bacterium]|nr:5'/3'-nucleotidase SurE [Trueperaceae bacterium]